MRNETSSKRLASIAGRVQNLEYADLLYPGTSVLNPARVRELIDDSKSLAGSVLTQAKDRQP